MELVDQKKNVVENMETTMRNGCLTPGKREGKQKMCFDHAKIFEYESNEQYDDIASPTTTTGEEDVTDDKEVIREG